MCAFAATPPGIHKTGAFLAVEDLAVDIVGMLARPTAVGRASFDDSGTPTEGRTEFQDYTPSVVSSTLYQAERGPIQGISRRSKEGID